MMPREQDDLYAGGALVADVNVGVDGGEPDDLQAAAVAETLASCVEQLRYVRARIMLRAGPSATNPDDMALLRTLDGVEILLTRVAEAMTART